MVGETLKTAALDRLKLIEGHDEIADLRAKIAKRFGPTPRTNQVCEDLGMIDRRHECVSGNRPDLLSARFLPDGGQNRRGIENHSTHASGRVPRTYALRDRSRRVVRR